MKNLTDYSDQELSLQVFNSEYLYSERGNRDYLIALINEEFICTEDQIRVLFKDLDEAGK